jgi:hypothetical protein
MIASAWRVLDIRFLPPSSETRRSGALPARFDSDIAGRHESRQQNRLLIAVFNAVMPQLSDELRHYCTISGVVSWCREWT